MKKGHRKFRETSVARMVFVGISLLLQIGWILVTILELHAYSALISLVSGVLAAVVVLAICSKNTNGAFKLPWIILIMAMPVMGISLYLLVESNWLNRWSKKRIGENRSLLRTELTQDPAVLSALEEKDVNAANLSNYLWRHTQNPVCANTKTTFYAEASDALAAMKRDLEQAERFIFMEYFIVEHRESFGQILDILVRKAKQGVEVRLMYDDIGSVGYVNWKFAKRMNKLGIHCQVFNPAIPVLNFFMNHRDHRKITVIDGKVGYTGGYNLADEYFGITQPFGKWKDTGLRLEGDGVKPLSAMFLELWSFSSREKEDYKRYLDASFPVAGDGYVQPFDDNPLLKEQSAENVLLNLIGQAKRYIYFITPYLIITDEMRRALTLAAKRGVDVRIITPGIPDKKIVYSVTRSYYAELLKQGVRIFEYSPGFCHAKQCVCDGEAAVIGTSNLDYRSLYLHFENNVLLYDCRAVRDIEKDFREMFPICREVPRDYGANRSVFLQLWQYILRLFAPML